jgi:putative endonuclease
VLTNTATGVAAENKVCSALAADGWAILGRRIRTAAGEIDAVAEKAGLVAFVEVKARPTLAAAAAALGARQQARLIGAAEILLAENPHWGASGARFDVMLVDRHGSMRRITDAFRVH